MYVVYGVPIRQHFTMSPVKSRLLTHVTVSRRASITNDLEDEKEKDKGSRVQASTSSWAEMHAYLGLEGRSPQLTLIDWIPCQC